MKKRLHAIALLCCCIIIKGSGQPIYFSNNKLNVSAYRYKVVGEVNNNIIVWATPLSKQQAAKIFVYDKSMQLVNTINTTVIQAEPATGAHFFITGNSFQVLYPSKTKDSFLLKLAAFNETGEMLYNRTLDGAEQSNNTNNENVYYQVLQSQRKKILCFTKMESDRQRHILKFSFSFIKGNDIMPASFSIPFNEDLEDITDMLVDDDRNILLLKEQKLNTAVKLTLVKLNFKENFVSGTSKAISNYFVKPNSMHLAQNNDGYSVFGLLKKENSSLDEEEALYVWQTSEDLFDLPGDTILTRESNNSLATYATCITGNTVFSNIFAVWNAFENADAAEETQWHQPFMQEDVFPETVAEKDGAGAVYNNISLLYYDEKALLHNSPYTVSFIKETDKYQPNKLQLLTIDSSNNIAWQTAITNRLDNITMANLNNARIITSNKQVHVICEVMIKDQPRSLNHITIQANGTITEKLITNWGRNCKYNLDASVFTDKGSLIIPGYKGKKLVFANIKLE